eukprot:1484690-Rhodomonas_salina.2
MRFLVVDFGVYHAVCLDSVTCWSIVDVHPEIKYKRTQTQYSLFQERDFLYLTSYGRSRDLDHVTFDMRSSGCPSCAQHPCSHREESAYRG